MVRATANGELLHLGQAREAVVAAWGITDAGEKVRAPDEHRRGVKAQALAAYTALSRGKRRVIVISGRDGIAEAVRSPGTRRIGGVIERLHLQAANSNFPSALTLPRRVG